MVGYADDVALVGQGRSWDILAIKLAEALHMVINWLNENHLQLAFEKTEAIIIGYGRPPRDMNISVLGQPIRQSKTMKYLGITLDATARFGPHIRLVAAKAEAAIKALSRLMPNIGGPGEKKRRVSGYVAQSIMLYGAPVWANVMAVETYKRIFQSVQDLQGIYDSLLWSSDDSGIRNTHSHPCR